MYRIVDGLARLVAPILPVTAEQLWKALPGDSRSLGAPRGVSVARAADAFVDDALVATGSGCWRCATR